MADIETLTKNLEFLNLLLKWRTKKEVNVCRCQYCGKTVKISEAKYTTPLCRICLEKIRRIGTKKKLKMLARIRKNHKKAISIGKCGYCLTSIDPTSAHTTEGLFYHISCLEKILNSK